MLFLDFYLQINFTATVAKLEEDNSLLLKELSDLQIVMSGSDELKVSLENKIEMQQRILKVGLQIVIVLQFALRTACMNYK